MSSQVLVQVPSASPAAPRLLDQVRQRALTHFGRPEPGERFAEWVRRFVIFHGMRHPRELDNAAVGRFLEHVAQSEKDPLRGEEKVAGPFFHPFFDEISGFLRGSQSKRVLTPFLPRDRS